MQLLPSEVVGAMVESFHFHQLSRFNWSESSTRINLNDFYSLVSKDVLFISSIHGTLSHHQLLASVADGTLKSMSVTRDTHS